MMPRGGLLHATSGACAVTVALQQELRVGQEAAPLAVQCAAGQQWGSTRERERVTEGQRDRERERAHWSF
jgi:hypothetical protein